MADSQLLFHRGAGGEPFLASLHSFVPGRVRCAAYLGASNGDRKEFFDLFAEAMKGIDVTDARHVPAEAREEDRAAIDSAELILLAGGDVERGFSAFERSGVSKSITEAYLRGAILVGVSAGAVQLGLAGFRFLPFWVGAHEEPAWEALRKTVARGDAGTRGIGIPSGGGAIFHRDGSLEPVRRPLLELVVADDGALSEAFLVPPHAD